MSSPELKPKTVHYPETDGKPMAESDLHRDLMLHLIAAIQQHFRDDPEIYVSGNLFIYFEEGDPESVVAPDLFVVRGVEKKLRRIYKLWEEGKGPDLVIELTSRGTHLEDLGKKRAIYESLGVKEYFIFDPEGYRFQPQMRGFRLIGGALQPIAETRLENGAQVFLSEVTGLELHGRGSSLRWVDPKTGKILPFPPELYDQVEEEERRVEEAMRSAEAEKQRAEAEKQRAEAEKQRAEAEKQRAESQRDRAEAAEAEISRLREEISRLRGGKTG